ncbi:hypothetical protein, partial [Photobacterium sp. R1]
TLFQFCASICSAFLTHSIKIIYRSYLLPLTMNVWLTIKKTLLLTLWPYSVLALSAEVDNKNQQLTAAQIK